MHIFIKFDKLITRITKHIETVQIIKFLRKKICFQNIKKKFNSVTDVISWLFSNQKKIKNLSEMHILLVHCSFISTLTYFVKFKLDASENNFFRNCVNNRHRLHLKRKIFPENVQRYSSRMCKPYFSSPSGTKYLNSYHLLCQIRTYFVFVCVFFFFLVIIVKLQIILFLSNLNFYDHFFFFGMSSYPVCKYVFISRPLFSLLGHDERKEKGTKDNHYLQNNSSYTLIWIHIEI